MRASLAIIAAFALCATPVVAQGKTKGGVVVGDAPTVSIEALETCESFAKGDILAIQDAIAHGWDASVQDGESPYVREYTASKDLPGIGPADLFALIENYPSATLGYCRIDVIDPSGDNGHDAIQAIQNLDRYEGQSQMISTGTFASFTGAGGDHNTLLLTHWSADSFVIQLTVISPKATPAN